MNQEQKAYIEGKFTRQYVDVVSSGIASLMLYGAIASPGFEPVIGFGILSLPFVALGCGGAALRAMSMYLRLSTKSPFAQSEEIIFEDKKGLEALLDVTAEDRVIEWATAHKAHMDNGRAVIHHILHPDDAQKEELIMEAGEGHVTLNMTKIYGTYNGIHHFHPTWGGRNFAVNPVDRAKPAEWINLLTFNMPYGPEIIGFNLNHTYIPAKREDKTRLVRAKTRDIWRYLGAQCIV